MPVKTQECDLAVSSYSDNTTNNRWSSESHPKLLEDGLAERLEVFVIAIAQLAPVHVIDHLPTFSHESRPKCVFDLPGFIQPLALLELSHSTLGLGTEYAVDGNEFLDWQPVVQEGLNHGDSRKMIATSKPDH